MTEEDKILNLEARDKYDLFSDTTFKAIYDEFPEEEKKTFKAQGEYMYDKDYATINTDLQGRLIEAAAYINEGMKSGLRPSQLDDSEREVMRSLYGTVWYEKYDFKSEAD